MESYIFRKLLNNICDSFVIFLYYNLFSIILYKYFYYKVNILLIARLSKLYILLN